MTSGIKFALGGTAVLLLAVGGELLYLHHERNKPWTPPTQADNGPTDPDDLVFLKKKHPSDMSDLKDLYGKTVWVQAGGQMTYFPSTGHHADYSKPAGTLLGAEPLAIQDGFEQVAPKNAETRVPTGDRQVLLAFTMPKSPDPKKVYAVPVGVQQSNEFTFFTDDMFFYDDPHQLYNYWSPQIWQAIDSHQVIQGMNERQVGLSLGQMAKSESEEVGNRVVVFNNDNHPIAVTFVKNHVTAFHPDQGY